MVSFNRGRGRPQSEYKGRGSSIPSLRRGQGGRSVTVSLTRGGRKTLFNPTRVDEQNEETSDYGDDSSRPDTDLSSNLDGISSDEERLDATATTVKPYSALLQSLNARTVQEQPPPKKRKISQVKAPQNSQSRDEDLDLVLEPEEADISVVDELVDDEDDEEFESHDPFMTHLNDQDGLTLAQKVEDIKNSKWLSLKIFEDPQWTIVMRVPASSKDLPPVGMKIFSTTRHMLLKKKLEQPAARLLPSLDPWLGSLAYLISGYKDVLFPFRTLKVAENIRRLTCLHSLNHVFKTRDKIIKNNARVAHDIGKEDIELRDQGFTRPKVLIVLPTRQSCSKYIEAIISLAEPEQLENKKRFQDSYIQEEDKLSKTKPEDFKELFSGNDDDMFRVGLKFTRKSIKFFAQFYNSDIIFASPLGLRMALGAENYKQRDHDFLSSIEIVIVDQCDALAMQNWEHIEYIFEHLNLQPKEAHGCDFSRVRHWYLDDNAKYFRQTILLSAYSFPSLNSLYSRHVQNIAGKARYSTFYNGAMLDLGIQAKQTFSRYNTLSPITDPDDRFDYFTTVIMPSLTKYAKTGKQGTLIYLPSYADFVRIRNYLATSSIAQNISFGSICEYTSLKDVARARSHFISGRHSLLLYTERAHHFRRYHLKGVKAIIMYGLPENPLFYKEIVEGYMGSSTAEAVIDANMGTVRCLFSKLDKLKLERIVGTKRVASLIKNKNGDTFDFI